MAIVTSYKNKLNKWRVKSVDLFLSDANLSGLYVKVNTDKNAIIHTYMFKLMDISKYNHEKQLFN